MTSLRPLRLAGLFVTAGMLFSLVPSGGCRPKVESVTVRDAGARHAPAPEAAAPDPTRAAPARAEASGYDFRQPEKAAVDGFLRQNPELRVAKDEDRRPGEGGDEVAELYGVYHPYFVRGDANDDGLLDFLLAFVHRDSDREVSWFSVVLFSGLTEGGFSAGNFLERDISLTDGDLSLDRDTIVVTPDTADEAARRYRWDPTKQRHVFVHDTPEEPASLPPAQT